MAFMWFFALFLSVGLRFWGVWHPEPFIINPFLIWGLLFGPSFVLASYLIFIEFRKSEI